MLNGIELPLHQNLICWPSATATLKQSLRVIWDVASWATVLILPHNSQSLTNSQLSSCASFLVDTIICWALIQAVYWANYFTQAILLILRTTLSDRYYYLVDKDTGSKRLSILPKITKLMPKLGLTPSLLFHPLGPTENDRRRDETRQAGSLYKKYTCWSFAQLLE